ncbi:MAG TPA: septum formation initiator family protein, partial [Streptomyces sp.]
MAVKDKDRFSTATRLRALGEQTAARVYRSQTKRQQRRSRLTGRAALLALVLCTLVVALAYPMRQYVSQRAEIADLEREQEAARQKVEQLRDLKARWQDDAYAEQQIRLRLHYVLPGETGFVVV